MSAETRPRPVPVDGRERHGRARPRARGRTRSARSTSCTSRPASRCDALCDERARRASRDRRGHAAPPLPDGRGRALARPEREDEPAARAPRTTATRSSRRSATARSARSRPITRRMRGTRRTCRSRTRRSASRASRPSFAALHTYLVLPGELDLETLLERMSTGPARALGLAEPRIEAGARANLVALDLDAEWEVTEDGFRSLSANSWLLGETLARSGRPHRRRRARGVRRMTAGYLAARGRDGLPGPLGRRRGRRLRRGGVHDRDDRLPGDGDRPELRGAARLLHGADGRQLRRRRRAGRVRPAARESRRSCDSSEAGSGPTGSLRHGLVALEEIDTRALVLRAARRRARCGPWRSPTRASCRSTTRSRQCARSR